MELSKLERAVLDKILSGNDEVMVALREQLRTCRVKEREFTGHGFFTDLELDPNVPPAPAGWESAYSRVRGEIGGLVHGGGFVLFLEAGLLNVLEGYAYDEPWPDEEILDFDLFYFPERTGDSDAPSV